MGTKKIIFFASFIWLIVSCESPETNQVISRQKEEISTLKKSLERTKHEKEQAIKRDLEQSKIIDDALLELGSISQSSNKIRISLGETKNINYLTQTERLSEQIESIKERLDSLQDGYPNLYHRIESLKMLVETKNEEIVQLKNDIERKNQELEAKTDIIINQDIKIDNLNNNVIKAEKEIKDLHNKNEMQMAELWYEMGEKLVTISLNLPKVRGARDKRMMEETKSDIQKNAKKCYKEACNLGHSQAYSKYVRY